MQARRSLAADDESVRELDVTVSYYRASLVFTRLLGIIGIVSMATLLAVGAFGLEWWTVFAAGLASLVLVILAEVPMRPLVARKPEAFLDRAAVPLAVLSGITRPVTRLIPMSPETPFIQAEPEAEEIEAPADAEEFKQLVTDLDETPEIREDERELIDGVLGLKETAVKEIMVPRPDIHAVSTEASFDDILDLMVKSGCSRIPLYEQSLDNVVGVVYAQDVLRQIRALSALQTRLTTPSAQSMVGSGIDLRTIARKPLFVPEMKNVYDLLAEFRSTGVHFALVVDEYGGVEGLVTLSDVMEEIVGELVGEFAPHSPAVRVVSETEVLVDGAVSLEEVNEALDLDLEGERIDTIGGYVLHHLGRIPKAGDVLRANGIVVEVVSTSGRRIKRLRVKKAPAEVPEGAA